MTNPVSACIACGSTHAVPHLRGLLRCPSCTHVWADMRLSEDELRKIYSRDYFHGTEYANYELEKKALERNFARRLRTIKALFPQGGTLWEIGCAYGFFLKLASDFFSVAGCDISEHAAEYARTQLGLSVTATDYLELPVSGNGYNVVCLWDTIEHLQQPDLYITKAFQDLQAGGLICVSTGDVGSLLARIRGEKWRLIHPPSHLHYFTQQSIRTLLTKTGFTDINITYDPFYRHAGTVLRKLTEGSGSSLMKKLSAKFQDRSIFNFYFPLNTFDLMTVYGRKP